MVVSSLSMNQCHLYAQKLNNSAALCIEIGHYDRAIFSLTKALRLSREQTDESMLCGCSCYQCSLDGCIAYSETCPPVSRPQSPVRHEYASQDDNYVYKRPIRIPPQPILENHNMGRTLFLIITFNLAMAHHLGALATAATSSTSPEAIQKQKQQLSPKALMPKSNGDKIKKALQLYEVSQSWHSRITAARPLNGHDCELHHARGVNSIRFRMILNNNLSHIHRMTSNHAKQRQCLENLLSTVMVIVEYNSRTNSNSNSNSSSISSLNNNTSEETSQHCSTNLQVFLKNASQLFERQNCAEAA